MGAVLRAEGKSCFSNLVLLLPELGTAQLAPSPAPPHAVALVLLQVLAAPVGLS